MSTAQRLYHSNEKHCHVTFMDEASFTINMAVRGVVNNEIRRVSAGAPPTRQKWIAAISSLTSIVLFTIFVCSSASQHACIVFLCESYSIPDPRVASGNFTFCADRTQRFGLFRQPPKAKARLQPRKPPSKHQKSCQKPRRWVCVVLITPAVVRTTLVRTGLLGGDCWYCYDSRCSPIFSMNG